MPLTCGHGAGDYHTLYATMGCDSEACCAAICEEDPFCCDTEWEQAQGGHSTFRSETQFFWRSEFRPFLYSYTYISAF